MPEERTGPRPLVPAGCVLGATGLALLTGIGPASTYAGGVLPALLVMGFGMGLVFGPAQNAATGGVTAGDAGVASAMVNIGQQIGGSIGTAVFSALAATETTSYLHAHAAAAAQPAVIAAATIASYHLVFWIAAAVFLVSGALAALLFRSGPRPADPDAAVSSEP